MKIAICDDKNFFHRDLKEKLDAYAASRHLPVLYTDFTRGSDLVASTQEFDLIFMDYQMEGMDGLETSRKLRAKELDTPIIFLTSFPHIVFESFSVNTYRFLVKPLDAEKLTQAMDDFLADMADERYVVIQDADDTRRIRIDDIIYAEASDKYCYIRVGKEVILYKKTLAEFEKMLPADQFFRSHRTYLVGFRHIISHTAGDIIFDNQERALISKLKLSSFRSAFVDYVKRYRPARRTS